MNADPVVIEHLVIEHDTAGDFENRVSRRVTGFAPMPSIGPQESTGSANAPSAEFFALELSI
jgi:hypothetical protein